jgi:hypothetical protein
MENINEEAMNAIHKEILTLSPAKTNVERLRSLTQDLINLRSECGQNTGGLLHTLGKEIKFAEDSSEAVEISRWFKKAQSHIEIDIHS